MHIVTYFQVFTSITRASFSDFNSCLVLSNSFLLIVDTILAFLIEIILTLVLKSSVENAYMVDFRSRQAVHAAHL